jgi:hypothetical protein
MKLGRPATSLVLASVAMVMLVFSAHRWYRGWPYIPFPALLGVAVLALVLLVVAVRLTPARGLRRDTPVEDPAKRASHDKGVRDQ